MARPGSSSSISTRARSRNGLPSSSCQNKSWLSASRKIGLIVFISGFMSGIST
jgi:hypothetical protein